MADIAFLLLVFFLITTTIENDVGIQTELPAWEQPVDIQIEERNLLKIFINGNNELMVNNKVMDLNEIQNFTYQFVGNAQNNVQWASSPKEAVVSIKLDEESSYKTFIHVYDGLKIAYHQLRDEAAMEAYNLAFDDVTNPENRAFIADLIPIQISEELPFEM